jgi:hypothetical protein
LASSPSLGDQRADGVTKREAQRKDDKGEGHNNHSGLRALSLLVDRRQNDDAHDQHAAPQDQHRHFVF